MKRELLFASALLLAACVNDPPGPAINAQLNLVQGHPVREVFNKLGYPTGESGVAGTKFYYWSNSAVIMQPTTIETTGIEQVGHKTVTYDQTTFGPDQAIPTGCTIRVFVDPYENVVSHDFSGDRMACGFLAQKLDPTYSPYTHLIR